MRRFLLRSLISLAIPVAAGAVVASCARKAVRVPDPMTDMVECDTTPMKPLGRRVEIPEVTPRPNQAALTGSVVQIETGDAIDYAVIDLRPSNPPPKPVQIWKHGNAKGGFSFDSVAPGVYKVRVRRLGEYSDTAVIQLTAGRVDTLLFRLRAYRCYGY